MQHLASVGHHSSYSLFHGAHHTGKAFVNARSWLRDVREHADPNISCILVANKTDLCDENSPSPKKREITTEEAERWAKEEEIGYIEASAKTGANVNEAFNRAARMILMKIKAGLFDDKKSSGVKRNANSNTLTLESTPAQGGCQC
ncbi:hypothetical protein FRC03_005484 [Tulasnella sp. 419]|nr:hypothetical protein FRC02_003569 [Tulasnella sp. 418]KAG8968939.1 hypothetical protein FRC03_005484 [Tulasnella sp. 419]